MNEWRNAQRDGGMPKITKRNAKSNQDPLPIILRGQQMRGGTVSKRDSCLRAGPLSSLPRPDDDEIPRNQKKSLLLLVPKKNELYKQKKKNKKKSSTF